MGAWRVLTGAVQPVEVIAPMQSTGQTLTLFLLLTAFSNGCTAMTGVEAVSNGVPAFRPPEAKNAAATMLMMATLSITMFVGITLLAQAYHVVPTDQETIVSQIARGVFGGRGVPYYLVQAATMLILVLAANTAYADFPRLASILARDRYLPRQFMNQGDRLAFSNGIVGLSIFASVLLVLYGVFFFFFFICLVCSSLLGLIAVGAWRVLTGAVQPVEVIAPMHSTGQTLTLFLLLTAFSNGCTAMTGVEAVSNGVPAFKPPEAKNAAATMLMMATLSITMFVGITLLAQTYHVVPTDQETIVSQIARGVFGGRGVPYYLVQAATMLILVLAANTAYADFPRLASILARDRYLPRQFMNQGDRLAFSNGIVGLSILASVLLVLYGGDTHSLIPLYMIGVFVSFTLSQSGMVMHWRRVRGPGWRSSAGINGFGAMVTAIVLVVVAVTKAHEGAWIVLLLIPVHVLFFRVTKRHYDGVASQLSLKGLEQARSTACEHSPGADQRCPSRCRSSRRVREDAIPRRAGDLCQRGSDDHRTPAPRLGAVGSRRAARRSGLSLSFVDGAVS